MNHRDFIYVVMIQSYKSDIKIKINVVSTFVENVDDAAKKMSFEFRNFDDVFSLKNEKILTNRKENVDHVIELKKTNNHHTSFLIIYSTSSWKHFDYISTTRCLAISSNTR
jgi:hypothetical protein